ncbi:NADP-binding protein [Dacryopinax primogenitus]|uniref:NADP-binding protein n=1 Tax=Dacryopinax primogenitus (strain DJM 731) TaxID=1858805 RepID=M5GAG4_DACPD|nr:NADP-binding protein [Dacryopinax primogenitus]EJU00903.1 NADP-binding protein [Dacryopinax primogenitus]
MNNNNPDNLKPVVLITGCTKGGIGYSLCESFAPHASVVYATSRSLGSMTPFPRGNIKCLELDVTSDESVQAAIGRVLEEEGRVDVVVSNAGGMSIGPILDADIPELKRSFDTNVFGTHRLARACIPGMLNRHYGLFVLVSSVTALTPGPWHGIYSAGKSALLNYGETLALECAPFNVHLQLLIPGAVRSNLSLNESSRWPGLPPGSLYSPWEKAVRERMVVSQSEGVAMDTQLFAQRSVERMIRGWRGKKKLGRRVVEGGMCWAYWFVGMWPRAWQLAFIWWLQGKRG